MDNSLQDCAIVCSFLQGRKIDLWRANLRFWPIVRRLALERLPNGRRCLPRSAGCSAARPLRQSMTEWVAGAQSSSAQKAMPIRGGHRAPERRHHKSINKLPNALLIRTAPRPGRFTAFVHSDSMSVLGNHSRQPVPGCEKSSLRAEIPIIRACSHLHFMIGPAGACYYSIAGVALGAAADRGPSAAPVIRWYFIGALAAISGASLCRSAADETRRKRRVRATTATGRDDTTRRSDALSLSARMPFKEADYTF